MTHLSSVVALGGLVFLTACGGGDGGDNPVADHAENSAKVSRIIASTSALAQTSAASMRVTGRVEYDGVVGMAFGGAPASLRTAEMIGADLILAEKVEGENTLLHMAGMDWTGRVGDRTVSLGLSHAKTGGASLFDQPREDRITRFSAEVPVGRIDLGGFAERRRSTIDAYDRSDFGITVAFGFDLLKDRAPR